MTPAAPASPPAPSIKRPATAGNNVSDGSLPNRVQILEQSNPEIGSGDYASALNLYTAKQLLTVERRVASLEGVLYKHFEITDPTALIDPCKEMGKLYTATCRSNKGKRVGPFTNYCVLGLVNGLLVSPKTDPKNQEILKTWLMDVVGNTNKDGLDLSKAQEVFQYVPYCQVKIVDKRGKDPIAYITLAFGDLGNTLKPVLIQTLLTIGHVNPSPPPPTPAMQELKQTLTKMGIIADPAI